jgi:asparagine synthase (glutamine-hydrolysing)
VCGISGYWSRLDVAQGVIVAMNTSLRHRGPDEQGYFRDQNIAFGHRRLSVVDLADSHQPMSTPDGQLTLVFNGEIYNFPALRRQLGAMGCEFRTHGDTETLLYAYRVWGTDMLQHLRGMFAFALWDRPARRLFLARDHLGVKPLHYAWDGNSLVFASELKAILKFPGVSTAINLDALGNFLECQYIPSPDCIYQGIKKLPPATAMLLEDGQLRTWRYWQADYSDKSKLAEDEALTALEAELRESITGMLLADVPLGCFLSGGLDSSLLAALMANITGQPVQTFSLGFTGNVAGSEHRYAKLVAEHIGSNHHQLMLAPEDVLASLDDWVEIFDEPFGDQAALPTMLLSKLARQQVTVALSGEGADEMFSGYSNYYKRVREERFTRLLGGRYSPLRHVERFLPAALRKERLIRAIGQPLARRYITIPSIFDRALHDQLFTPAFIEAQHTCVMDHAERVFHTCNSAHYIERLMHIDAGLWLPDDLLTKVDRASMAYSLEVRVPYLDHKFIEFCARLDPTFKQAGQTRKYLLKRLAEKYLPKEVVHRGKQGFVMPLSEWLAGGLKQEALEALSATGLGKRGLFQRQALEKLVSQHYSGKKRNAGRLWTLLALERWFRRYAPEFSL